MPRAEVWGSPVGHSLSPRLHRAAYSYLRLPWTYTVRTVGEAQWDEAWRAQAPGLAGISVTMPLKRLAATCASERSEVVTSLGVANTLTPGEGGWRADNTDATAMARLLEGVSVDEVLLVGGGATACSAVWALGVRGAVSVTVATRSGPRPGLTRLAGELGLRVREASWEEPIPAQTVIATVPAAAREDYLRRHASGLPDQGFLLDAAYGDVASAVQGLRGRGWLVRAGHDLLVEQAVDQVELMTGRRVPGRVLAEALETTCS